MRVNLGRYARTTPIYIDSHLGDGIRGEDFAKELHDAGFSRVYLATGSLETAFPPMPWLSEIVGKEPPGLTNSNRLAGTKLVT